MAAGPGNASSGVADKKLVGPCYAAVPRAASKVGVPSADLAAAYDLRCLLDGYRLIEGQRPRLTAAAATLSLLEGEPWEGCEDLAVEDFTEWLSDFSRLTQSREAGSMHQARGRFDIMALEEMESVLDERANALEVRVQDERVERMSLEAVPLGRLLDICYKQQLREQHGAEECGGSRDTLSTMSNMSTRSTLASLGDLSSWARTSSSSASLSASREHSRVCPGLKQVESTERDDSWEDDFLSLLGSS